MRIRGITGSRLFFVRALRFCGRLPIPYKWRRVIASVLVIAALYKIIVALVNVFKTDPPVLLIYRNRHLFCESILTLPEAESLASRIVIDPDLLTESSPKKLWAPFGLDKSNLNGCHDWKCEIANSSSNADVIITSSPVQVPKKRLPDALVVYFSQESPAYSFEFDNQFNFTFSYRHDSPGASPYGYTVKLAERSRIPANVSVIDDAVVAGKTKAAAWFVSHCDTNSLREKLVEKLQAYVKVDVFGACSELKCDKGADCENDIDKVYHFYMALENSICTDYITEKLWNQGFGHNAIPIVLQRSIVEKYVPPWSFIAFDDYNTLEDMGAHLNDLMNDKNAYKLYFDWRRDYEVIFLDGQHHDWLERPWGVCQICRTAHLHAAGMASTLPFMDNTNLSEKWSGSCEAATLARKFLDPG